MNAYGFAAVGQTQPPHASGRVDSTAQDHHDQVHVASCLCDRVSGCDSIVDEALVKSVETHVAPSGMETLVR